MRVLPAAAALCVAGAAILLLFGLPAAEAPPAEVAAADSLALEQARAVASGLGKDLMKALLAALQEGGPPAAISFCADSAQAFTARHATEGIHVRRVSRRYRNPAGAPDSMEGAWLDRLEAEARAGALPPEISANITRPDGTRELFYMRTITVAEPCLKCHGAAASLAPEVRQVLSERYPEDRATGFGVGDFRGAISVRIAVPPKD